MLHEDVRDSIDRLVSKVGSKDNELFLHDVLMSICRIAQDGINTADWKLFTRSIKEFRKSFKVFSKYRGIRKVSIFGSARTSSSDPCYQMVEAFSKQITEQGYMVITGAGGGIMEAGNKGAGDKSFGMNIRLPFEQEPNEFIRRDPKLISYRYFFIRKLMFIKESDATVLFPGGFGTLDEGYEGLTLLQTGKSMPRPVVLMAPPKSDYWEKWVSYFTDVMIPGGYINKEDTNLFSICNSAEEGVKNIVSFYKNYHSIRYVQDLTVLRLNVELSDHTMAALNEEYADIVVDGKIEKVKPFPEELMTRDLLKKPRLAFYFNKENYGRLVHMIRWINKQEV